LNFRPKRGEDGAEDNGKTGLRGPP
jgi:hypothetical protein